MINRWLFTQIDNSALIIFRVIFGFLIAAEAIGAIFTGWITRTLVAPQFTFTFIGFDFLQPLAGNGMYYYYALMGIIGLLVMVGYKYRWSMAIYTIMWAGVYFMQKTSYNNHYYLLLLLCIIMCFLPAGKYLSLDVKNKMVLPKIAMPRWCSWIFILQLWIVYTYASVAKWYPDWLDSTVSKNLMLGKADYFFIGELLQQHWAHVCIAYFGILYDLLIIPALLWKRTRFAAFCLSIFFHLFNSFVLQIGIFPYLSLAFSLFFFAPETIHGLFLKKKEFYHRGELAVPPYRQAFLITTGIWFVIQLGLPLRHWLIPGNVLWTEEGHRLSWRMMLRGRSGKTTFYVVDTQTKKRTQINLSDHLSQKQVRTVTTRPDVIWQFAQYLKNYYAKQGQTIQVFVKSRVSVNGKPYRTFIDPKTDLAAVSWNYFTTNLWIIKYPEPQEYLQD